MRRADDRLEAVFVDSWRPYLWVLVLALAAYARTLGFGFSPLDDRWLVPGHAQDLSALPRVFAEPLLENVYYRPLLTLSFALDAATGGSGPFRYHLTNVLLHALVSVTTFVFFGRMGLTRRAGFAFAALFAVHPANTHAVAWIPGRNDVMLALFALWAAIKLVDYLSSRTAAALALHLVFVASALLTKESAVVLPVVLLAYGLVVAGKRAGMGAVAGGWLLVLAPWFLLRRSLVADVPSVPHADLHAVAGSALTLYIGKLVVPVQLALFPTVRDSSLLPGLLVLVGGAAVATWRRFVDGRKALFGAIWFLAFLVVPVLYDAASGIDWHYEHRLYLPCIGFFLVLSQIDLRSWSRYRKPVSQLAFAVLTVLLLGMTVHRSGVYRDEKTIAEAGVRESPSQSLAYLVRGGVRSDAGDYGAAVRDFEKALELMPDDAGVVRFEGHSHLAATLAKQGRTPEAVGHYLEAVRLKPSDADVHNNLGNALARLGRLDEAVGHYTEALRMRPQFAEAHNNLGVALIRQGRVEEATRHFSEAVRIQPDYPGARQNLERALR